MQQIPRGYTGLAGAVLYEQKQDRSQFAAVKSAVPTVHPAPPATEGGSYSRNAVFPWEVRKKTGSLFLCLPTLLTLHVK